MTPPADDRITAGTREGEQPHRRETDMKAVHSEQYYRGIWQELISKRSDSYYMNLEERMEQAMNQILEAMEGVPAEQREKAVDALKGAQAKRIAEAAEKTIREEMAMVKRVESGKASRGYSDRAQATRYKAQMRIRFEFNCLQLADFKKKYIAG
jgi:hypothetical protein